MASVDRSSSTSRGSGGSRFVAWPWSSGRGIAACKKGGRRESDRVCRLDTGKGARERQKQRDRNRDRQTETEKQRQRNRERKAYPSDPKGMVSPAWQKTALGQFTAAQIPGGGQGSIPGEELVPAAPAREPAVDKASSAVAASADGRVVTCAPRLPRAVSGQPSVIKQRSNSGQTAVKQRLNNGQRRSNSGQTVVKRRSNGVRTVVKTWSTVVKR